MANEINVPNEVNIHINVVADKALNQINQLNKKIEANDSSKRFERNFQLASKGVIDSAQRAKQFWDKLEARTTLAHKQKEIQINTAKAERALERLAQARNKITFDSPKGLDEWIKQLRLAHSELERLDKEYDKLSDSSGKMVRSGQADKLVDDARALGKEYQLVNSQYIEAKRNINQIAIAQERADRLSRNTAKGFQNVQNEIKKTAQAAEPIIRKWFGRPMPGVFNGMNMFIGLLGVQTVAKEIFGLFDSDNPAVKWWEDATDSAIKFMSAGSSIGAFFGPAGPLIGAIAGGITGVIAQFFRADEATKEWRKELEKLTEASSKTIRNFERMSVDSLDAFVSFYDRVNEKIAENTKEMEKHEPVFKAYDRLMKEHPNSIIKLTAEQQKSIDTYKLLRDENEKLSKVMDDNSQVSFWRLVKAAQGLQREINRFESNKVKKDLSALEDELIEAEKSTNKLKEQWEELIEKIATPKNWTTNPKALISSFTDLAEKLREAMQAEEEARSARDSARKESLEKYKEALQAIVNAQKDLNDLTLASAQKATSEHVFPLISPELRELIAETKKELLDYSYYVDSLAQGSDESAKEYRDRIISIAGLSKKASSDDIVKFLENEKIKLNSLQASLDFFLSMAEKEQKEEQKKLDFKRKLRQQDLDSLKALNKYMSDENTKFYELQRQISRENRAREQEELKKRGEEFKTQFQPALDTMNTLFNSMQENIEKGQNAFNGFFLNLGNAIKQQLRQEAFKYAIKAVESLALGFFYKAIPGGGQLAVNAFKSSALYAAIALAAGGGSALLGLVTRDKNQDSSVGSSRPEQSRDSSFLNKNNAPITKVTQVVLGSPNSINIFAGKDARSRSNARDFLNQLGV